MEPEAVKKEAADQPARPNQETTGTAARPDAGPQKPDTLKFILNTLVFLAVLAASFGAYYFLSFPVGKITFPPEGSRISREVEIEGYTNSVFWRILFFIVSGRQNNLSAGRLPDIPRG